MAAGKAGAVQQRQQEREAAAQKRAAAKVRAEKRAAVAAEQKADRGVPLAMMPMLGSCNPQPEPIENTRSLQPSPARPAQSHVHKSAS